MWNAKVYEMFQKERLQPSVDLVNRIGEGKFQRIIDIGCGSGMSTLALREKFKDAEITGVDLSEDMLKKARDLTADVEWIRRDCSRPLDDLGKFDLVFSNAFLQWLHNQEEFVRNAKELLKENGTFALQIPSFEEMKISELIKETAKEFDKDGKLFGDVDKVNHFNYSPNEYYTMFSRYYSDIDIWQTSYIHQMDSCEAIVDFVRGTALITYIERMDEEQNSAFMKMLLAKVREYYTACDNGKVLFEFKRLFIIAKK